MLSFEIMHKKQPAMAVLLIHGMTGSPFELKKYAQHLYAEGFDVFAYSLPGHGEFSADMMKTKYSDWLGKCCYDFERLCKNYSKVFLSGLCLGAVLSFAIAESYPDKVAGVIALSTTFFLDGWRMPWYSFLMPIGLSTILRFYYTYPECEPYGIKNERTRNVIKKLLEKSEVGLDNFPMTCIYELLELSKLTRKNLKKVICPALILHSKEDDLTSVKSAKLAYNKISSNEKDLIILNDSYHMLLYDNEKEFVYKKVSEWLKSHSAVNEEAVCFK